MPSLCPIIDAISLCLHGASMCCCCIAALALFMAACCRAHACRAAVIKALGEGVFWPIMTKPEVAADLVKKAHAKMEAAGALGLDLAGAKAV